MMSRLLTSALALSFASTALASIPQLQFSVQTGAVTDAWVASGVALANPGQYEFVGSHAGQGFTAGFNMTASDTSFVAQGLMGGAFSVTNQSSSTQQFSIDIRLPTTAQGRNGLVGGFVSAMLTADQGGGTLASIDGMPMWSALIEPGRSNSTFVVATLLDGPQAISANAFTSSAPVTESFDRALIGLPSLALGDSMSIRFNFSLTAGDRVDFNTLFQVQAVPAAGALPALAGMASLAGLVAGRRRRA